MKKKSLKKVTSAVLVAAMSMGLLAGCGGSKSSGEAKTDADGATVIKFGIHVANPKKQETVTYNIVQGFNKENKGKYKAEFKKYEIGSTGWKSSGNCTFRFSGGTEIQ